jgi:hypothetical protein
MAGLGLGNLLRLARKWLVLLAMSLAGVVSLIGGIVYLVQNLPNDPGDSTVLAFGMAFVFAGGALTIKASQQFPALLEATSRRWHLLHAINREVEDKHS